MRQILNNILKQTWLLFLIGLIFGYILNPVLHRAGDLQKNKLKQPVALRLTDPNYPLIRPLLGFDSAEATDYGQLSDLKSELIKQIDSEKKQGNAAQISVYFRQFDTAEWIQANGDEQYVPASLFKVPIMMVYYHLAESDPALLSKQLTFTGQNDIDNEQVIKPAQQLVVGKSYTVEQLIETMIIYSDNDADQLLVKNLSAADFNKIFSDFRILLPTTTANLDFITVKDYALFLRALYGSTYLNRADSEKALELLRQSAFKDGLSAGVPGGVEVAHKFGEHAAKDSKTGAIIGDREFHDCGIVYDSKSPYLLCVMTKGNDLTKLETAVRDISRAVYNNIAAAH